MVPAFFRQRDSLSFLGRGSSLWGECRLRKPIAGSSRILLGNSSGDWKLNAHKAGQFYYNTVSDMLVIDSNGDGAADHYIGVKGVTSMKAAYFML
jgi:hypothetical protein